MASELGSLEMVAESLLVAAVANPFERQYVVRRFPGDAVRWTYFLDGPGGDALYRDDVQIVASFTGREFMEATYWRRSGLEFGDAMCFLRERIAAHISE